MNTGKAKAGLQEPDIDTKGEEITLDPGGHLIFRIMEVKDMGKTGTMYYVVKFDKEKKIEFTSPVTKTEQWTDGKNQKLDLPVSVDKIVFELQSKALLGVSFLGEFRIDVADIMSGYPYDRYYPLKGKGGKEDKKIRGKAHLQIIYVAPKGKLAHDEFKYPLHSIINSGRVDLFQKKIEDMGGMVSDPDDKGFTPLLHAAATGASPFAKILIEHQASLSEKNSDNRNPIHLAAMNGHCEVLTYLLCQKGADPDAPEQTQMKHAALHLAADANQGDACTVLIQAGANIDIQNSKGDPPLTTALMQQNGAPKSVTALVQGGANVYIENVGGKMCWEVAQRKDLCYSATTRNAFMKACDVIDPREFQIAQKTPQKQRAAGKNMTTDWVTSTQFLMTTKKEVEVTVLAYSDMRTDDCTKEVGFCIVKDKVTNHTLPSFQPEGIGFGGLDPFTFPMEKGFTYTAIVYSNNETLVGDFGVCLFTPKGAPKPAIKEAQPWKNTKQLSGKWSGKSAAGSSKPVGNPPFMIDVTTKKEAEVLIMLHQKTGDVSAVVFDDNRIMPSKFYIGMYIMTPDGKKELAKSERWHNSKDVYIRLEVGGDALPTSLMILPCTRLPEEELEFEITAYSDAKFSFSAQKKK